MSKKVDKKMEIWKKKLLDMGMRNRLLNYKETKRGNINITSPDLSSLYKMLVLDEKELVFPRIELRVQDVESVIEDDGEDAQEIAKPVEIPGDFSTDRTARETTQIAKNLKDKAKTAKEEQGVNILYASFGFLEWKEAEHSNVIVRSPLVLVPVVITTESINDPYVLSLHEDEIVVNPTLQYKMENEFGLELPEFDSQSDDILKYIAKVNRLVSKLGWKTTENVSISLLSFLRINMYKDLEKRADIISANDIVKALAGENRTKSLLDDGCAEYDHDKTPVQNVFQVVDADSSQQDAIEKSKKGVSFVLQGPPGTGKSQTITNIIAEALAAGKKVLFVSEKMAALEVVYRRLESVGLSDFCLVLHSNKANKREFMDSLRNVINLKPIAVKDSALYKLKTLEERRERLNAYSRELHEIVEPLGQSIYEANGLLAQYDDAPNVKFKLKDIGVENIDKEALYNIRLAISELVRTEQKLTEDYRENTWKNANIDELNHEKRHNLSSELEEVVKVIKEYLEKADIYKNILLVDLDICIKDYSSMEEFLRFASTCTGFPRKWLDANSYDEHFRVAKEAKERSARLKELREGIVSRTGEWFLEQNAIKKSEHIKGMLSEARQLLDDEYDDDRICISKTDELIKISNIVSEKINKIQNLLEKLSEETQINAPICLQELEKYADFAKKYSYNFKPNEFWFSQEWDDKNNREALIKQLRNLINQIQQARKVILEEYDKEILDIDYREILMRMRTDYTSFFRGFNSNYKADMNKIRSYRKNLIKKIPYEELISVLERIKEYRELVSTLTDNESKYVSTLGGWYKGEQTDFVAIENAISLFDSVKQGYNGHVPTELKELFLSGRNVDAYVSDAEMIRSLAKDDSISSLQQVLKNKNDDIIYLRKCCEKINDLFSECKRELTDALMNCHDNYSLLVCYDCLTNLSEMQILQRKEEEEANKCASLFDDLYASDLTDWDSVLSKLDWIKTYTDKRSKLSIDRSFDTRLISDADFVNTVKEVVAFLESFRVDALKKIESFDDLFNSNEGLLLKSMSSHLDKAERCKGNLEGLEDWIDFKNSIKKCCDLGLTDYVERVLYSHVQPVDYEAVFMKQFERIWLDYAVKKRPAVASFRGTVQDNLVQEFKNLDLEQFSIAQSRIREKLINSLPNVNSFISSQDEVGILMHELGKQRKIMPVRKLFDNIPNLLPNLKPCMMMSPLSVSQFIQSDNYMFDMVIFDEASQVKTENAIGAISRGKQVIIAGDIHQLPPTNFFAASVFGSDEYDEDEDDSEAFESILDEANTIMPQLTLKWHYRSRNEELIAFSNAKIYNNSLTTFPSPTEELSSEGVEYIYVPEGIYQRSSKRNNPIEAKKVVDVIFNELSKYPERSIGVITFSEAQQRCVEAEVIARRMSNPAFEDFFSEDKKEPFFIKNLENVQGDERDTIIFSIGYGKANPQEELKMNFGPINKSGGYRRLNVAVTRAKYSIKLVGSILPTDMRITDDTPKGVRLLRDYIEFAQQGVKAIENQITYTDVVETESPFEDSVYDYLTQNGYNVKTQVGCSGYRIDMAISHPSLDGRFVLGIECDGATYHSSRTARERDRLRQSVLESMGWKIYRIWSTDWIKDPTTEGKHLLEAVENAIKTYKEKGDGHRKNNVKVKKESNLTKYENELEVDASEKNGYGFEVFKEFEYDKCTGSTSQKAIVAAIGKIIDAQSPVHILTVCKQVAPLFGYSKTTAKVRENVEYIIRHALKSSYTIKKDDYVWIKGQLHVTPKTPEEGSKPRTLDMIAREELAEAMAIIINKSFGIEKEALFKVMAKEYGFSRTTEKMVEQLENAFALLRKQKRISDVDGKLSLVE